MARQITFEGRTYSFPDDATDEEVSDALERPSPERQSTSPPPVSQGEDLARSFGTGVVRGVGGLLGMRGDARNMVYDATTAIARGLGADETVSDAIGEGVGAALTGVTMPPTPQRRLRAAGGEDITAMFNQGIDAALPGDQGEYTPQTRLGRYARTIGEFVPGIAAPGGGARSVAQGVARTAGRRLGDLARSAATNVVAPAIASEAAGQVTEGTPWEAPARLAAAITGHLAAQNAGNIASRAMPAQFRPPEQRAIRLIDRGLRDAQTNISDMTRQAAALRRQGGTTAETVAEVSARPGARAQPLQRMARAVANVRGPGQQIAEETLAARTENVTPRVLSEATRAAAPRQTRAPRNFYDAREQLRAARSGQARENYRAAYQAPVNQAIYDAEIAPLMVGGSVQATAARRAAEIARAEVLRTQAQMSLARQSAPQVHTLEATVSNLQQQVQSAARGTRAALEQRLAAAQDELMQARTLVADADNLSADLAGTQAAVRDLDLIANGQAPAAANARVIDYFQRGLRQLAEAEPPRSQLGTAYNTAREAFVTAADRAAPQLGEARQLYGASVNIEEMMSQGRRVFSMPEGEIDVLLSGPRGHGLPIEEFDGFMLGVLDAIEQKIRAGDTAFVARFMRNENWQRQLTRALGGKGARRLRNRIAREAAMRRFDNSVRSGSQTTPMREDIAALTEGESDLGFLSEVVQSGGEIKGPIVRRLGEAYDRVIGRPGIYNANVNEALARRLFQPATEGNMMTLEQELAAIHAAQRQLNFSPTSAAASAYLGASSGEEKRRRLGP